MPCGGQSLPAAHLQLLLLLLRLRHPAPLLPLPRCGEATWNVCRRQVACWRLQ